METNSVTVHPGQVVGVSGSGYYDFPSVPGTQDFPVQGGAVTVGLAPYTTRYELDQLVRELRNLTAP